MTLYQATFEDDAIQAFYDEVTARTPDISRYARWSKGKQHLYAENTGWTDFYFFEFRQDHQTN